MVFHNKESGKYYIKKIDETFSTLEQNAFYICAEESYLSTILGNEYQQKENIIPNNLRYIRWKYENGNCPANLDIEHLFMLMNKEFLFARKFDSNSKKLIEIIDQYLIKEEKSFHNIVGKWDYNGFQQYPYNHKLAFQIASIGKYIKCMSAVDIGCGAGLYVSGLRRMGIPIIGFDANRYTSILSKMILPLNDQPCEVIDFSDEIDIETPYDLSICINTIEYVAPSKVEQFLKNIVRVTGKCLIANFTTDTLDNKRIMSFFTEEKFIENTYMSALLNKPIIQDSNFKSKIFCLLKV